MYLSTIMTKEVKLTLALALLASVIHRELGLREVYIKGLRISDRTIDVHPT
jgi:hypothetical protein